MSDLQLGFYVANDPHMEYHVRPHFYMEFDHEDFDVAAYEAAWNRALERHRRELCVVTPDAELRLLEGTPAIECRVYDLSDRSAEEVAEHLAAVRREMKRQELPLDRWPWLDVRASLWREQGRARARVHYNHNNFFSDGFGTNQLFAEIESYYRDPDLRQPPLAISYRDAVLAVERLARSKAGEAAKEYWFSRLPTLPAPPAIPQKPGVDRRRRSHLRGRKAMLTAEQLGAIKRRATSLGLTPSNAMIAAYASVLATWSNSSRFILSQMVTRRFRELPPRHHPHRRQLRVALPAGDLLAADGVVRRQRPRAPGASAGGRAPPADRRHAGAPGAQPASRAPSARRRARSSSAAACSSTAIARRTTACSRPLRRSSTTSSSSSRTAAACWSGTWWRSCSRTAWSTACGAPTADCSTGWRATRRRGPRTCSTWCRRPTWRRAGSATVRSGRSPGAGCTSSSTAQAARDAESGRDRVALAVAAGDPAVTTTYRELEARSARLAGRLRELGVARGDLVPVVMDRQRELVVAVLAVLRVGAAYVPIDPRLPAGRLAVLLGDLGRPGRPVRLALTQSRYVATEGAIDWPEGVTPLPVVADGEDPADALDSPGAPTDLAYVIHTSGSTGTPKGVMIDHRGALNTVVDVNERFGVGPDDAVLGVSAFNFDLSVYDLFGTFAAGARLVYPDPDAALDATHWLDLVLRESVTVWSSVPALMSLLVETAERRGVTMPSLSLVLLSGDKIPLDLPDAIRRVAPGAEIVSMGGATEASIWSIVYHPIDRIDPEWSTIPYGVPMVNQTWHVLDRTGRPCPTWVPGELYIGGVGLAKGYWNDPVKTARAFPPHPRTGERLYRTGDLGRYLPDGCIEWLGRVDFQVKIQGMRIELGEIEAVLGEHPAVRRAVAAVRTSAGGRHPRLVAFVVPSDADGDVGPAELEQHLAGLLPAHMVPRSWQLVDELPLTANGKVDRKRLLQGPFEEADEEVAARPEHVPPSGPVERRLQALWQEILGLEAIGVLDDFFDLGGQSFDAIRIFARVKEELGVAFTLGDLWTARTIRELGRRIEGGAPRAGEGTCVVPLRADAARDGAEPLFLVHPAGGSIMGYTRLAGALRRPLYGIRAPEGEQGAARRRDIRALASHHVAQLRQVRPQGPYTLGGWSSGAMVAFEMAAQLEAAGETVSEVFLLDGPAPFDHGEVADDRLLRWFLDDLALDLPVERVDGAEVSGLPLAEQLRTALSRFESPRALELDPDQLVPSFEIFRDLIVAGNRYRPPIVSADLTVVRVQEDVVDEFSVHPHRDDEAWGWREHTRGRVRCERVPGTHHSFLRDPLVQEWSSLLAGRT